MTDPEVARAIRDGIRAVQQEEYLAGLTTLATAYGSGTAEKLLDGLSYYGLCIALVEKKYKPAIDLCRKAIELQFYHGDHYANLTRVYLAAGNRRKAVETLQQGLKVSPEDEYLLSLRKEMGYRERPVVPFLSRDNPINRTLGRARHQRKRTERGPNEPAGES